MSWGVNMLVLSRRVDESLLIDKDIKITVLDIKGGQVRLGITAPQSITVHREEVFDRIQRDSSDQED
jgi:carbon storage regulator